MTHVLVDHGYGGDCWQGVLLERTGAGLIIDIGPHKILAPPSRVIELGDPMDDMMAEFCAEIERLQARHAATIQALETYLVRTVGERRPLKIDDVNLRDLAGVVFDDADILA